jgi:hypothetical protein
MIALHIVRITLLSCLLAGCSAQLLEEVVDIGEITPPRFCSEPVKLFNTFTMRAKRVAWKGDRGDPNATLTLELAFDNDKSFPVALSNSGNGVLYAVEFRLRGERTGIYAPKEAAGVTLVREPKRFKEPPHPGPFGYPTRRSNTPPPADKTQDVNYRITPGKPEEGKLVFQAPRDNYLLSVERKFDGKPAAGRPTDHISVCKISSDS